MSNCKKADFTKRYVTIVKWMALGVSIVVTVAASLFRLSYGVELSDEALSLAESELVIQGLTPYVNGWLQTPGFSIFNTGMLLLYKGLFHTYDGLFLFTRIVFLANRVLIALLVALVLRSIGFDKTICLSAAFPMITFYYAYPNRGYQALSIIFTILIGLTMLLAFQGDVPKSKWLCMAGALTALSIYSHPSDLASAILIFILLLCVAIRRKNRKIVESYSAGGLAVAAILAGWMLFRCKSVAVLWYGVQTILQCNPYFELKAPPMLESVKNLACFSKGYIVLFLISWTMNMAFSSARKNDVGECIYLVLGTVYTFAKYSGEEQLYKLGCLIAVYLIWQAKSMLTEHRTRALYLFTAIPALFGCIVLGATTWSGIICRLYLIIAAVSCVIGHIGTWKCGDDAVPLVAICISTLMTLCLIKSQMTYIYRDEPLPQLDTKVEEGVYKGLYTTKQRAETVEAVQNYLEQTLQENESVLFMETVPFAYLMTDAKACTPSSWDIALYSYGINDDTLYRRYFQVTRRTPDYIIYIDTGRDEQLSIKDDTYHFTKWVKQNYTQQADEMAGTMEVVVYKRNGNAT